MNSDNLSISFASGLSFNDASANHSKQLDHSMSSRESEDPVQTFLNEDKRSSWYQQQQKNYTILKDKAASSGKRFTRNTLPSSHKPSTRLKEDSVNRDWNHLKKRSLPEGNNAQISANRLYETRFRSLPCSLAKTYTIKNETKPAKQFHRPQAPCVIEPTRIHFECEVKQNVVYSNVAQLKLKNTSQKIITFLLFSSNGLLEFEMNEGALLEEEETEIEVKLKSEIIQRSQLDQAFDKLLVLIDQTAPITIGVSIDLIKDQESNPQRPKCPFCALEKGFPAHCF